MQLIAVEPGSDETTGLLSPINLLGLSFIFILIQQWISFSSMNFIFIDKQFDFQRAALHHDNYDIV